jgi:hypothetical protein
MSTIIQIKRNSGTTAPTTSDLVVGEMAYAYDASNDGASAKLYIEAVNSSSAADIHLIGGKYFTDLMDHTKGTLTANSAILTDGSSKIDVLNVDNVTINGNDVSTTDSNGNLTLTPNGTGMVVVNKTDGFRVPVGTTAQRLGSPTTGQLRYNSTTSQFEGYAASSWGSLGGVIDVDQDTKITAESAAGQDEDVLTFFTAGTAQVVIADGALRPVTDNDIDLGTSSLEFKDAFFDGTVTSDAFAGPLTGNVVGDLTGTIQTAAQGNITSLGTLTALTVDDVAINGKVVTMTGSSGDTATLTVGTNGTLDITTVDSAAAAANMTLTADGTFEAVGSTITLDSGGAINLEPASGSAILLDGTISVDAGVVTGATSITSTAFVGNITGDLTGTLQTAAQGTITSLGTLTALTVDDVAIDGKVVTMTGSASDTAVFTAGTNGTLSIVTTDAAAAAANIQITADGTVDIDSAGVLTLDSGAAINLEPAAGSAILLDGTISVDAGVVTGATSITSTAFVGTLSTAAQGNVTSLGTLTALTVDNLGINGNTITANSGAVNITPAGGSAIVLDGTISVDAGVVTGATSITSTAFVGDLTGTLQTAAQGNVTSLGTQTVLNVDNLRLDANTLSSTDSNGNITIAPNGTGNVVASTDTLQISAASDEGALLLITGGEGQTAGIQLQADESDDASDDWSILANTSGTLTFGNDIASAGTAVSMLTLTPHATVASSTTAIGGILTVAGATTFSGAVNMGSQATTNVNIDSGVIDGVTLGTNSAITDLRVDNIKVDGNTISSTDSNGHVNIAPNGSGNVAVTADTLSITGTEGETATLLLSADESDDASDDWGLTAGTDGVLSFTNDIASAGTQVAMVTMTPHATVASSTLAALGNVTIAGNLTVTGATTTSSSTNTTIADKLVELATGSTGSASGDVGHVIERGDDANVFIGWDESIDALVVGTGSFTGSTTGNLSHTLAAAKFGSLTLSTDLAVAEGGTGVSTFTDNGILYGDGSSALDVTSAPGSSPETTSNQILTANGSGVPKWTTTIDGGTY